MEEEEMVVQPHRPPTMHTYQKILQGNFKGFLLSRAENHAGKSKSCTPKYQDGTYTYARKEVLR